MDSFEYKSDMKDLKRRSALLSGVAGILGLGWLLTLCLVFTILGRERTVVVPVTAQRTFWLTAEHASPAYLEEMASFFAWLILDVSPETADWKREVLLKYTLPDHVDEIRKRLELGALRLRKINGSSTFTPRQLITDEKSQTVTLIGTERVLVNGAETSSKLKRYSAAFIVIAARIHLKSFEEVDDGHDQQTVAAGTVPQ